MSSRLFHGRKSGVSLSVVVIGGGLAGLAAAFSLQKAGHSAVLVAQNQGASSTLGLHVPPNMVKILAEWGLKDRITEKGFVCNGIDFVNYESDDLVAHVPFDPSLVEDSGVPFLFMTENELYDILYDVTKSAGVQILHETAAPVIDGKANCVKLDDGRTLSFDFLIGADGVDGVVRRYLIPNLKDRPKRGIPKSKHTTAFVDGTKMKEHPELSSFLEKDSVHVWMGPSCSVYAFPVNGRQNYVLEARITPSLEEDVVVDLESLSDEWDPTLKKLLSLSSSFSTVSHTELEPLDAWSFPAGNGHIILLGNTAQSLMPGSTSHSSLPFEDAHILGDLLSRLTSPSQESIELLLNAYSTIRIERTYRMHTSEKVKAELMTFSDDTSQYHRNRTIRAAGRRMTTPQTIPRRATGSPFTFGVDFGAEIGIGVEEEEEEDGADVKSMMLELWNYDAADEVEEWWLRWVLPVQRSEGVALARDRAQASVVEKGRGGDVHVKRRMSPEYGLAGAGSVMGFRIVDVRMSVEVESW